MKCFAVKNYSKSQDRVWILILGNRLHGNRDLEGSRHAHDRGIRLRSDKFEFANSVAHQPIHIVTIVFARNDGESRRLNQLFWSRGKIGRHECRTLLLKAGGARAPVSDLPNSCAQRQDTKANVPSLFAWFVDSVRCADSRGL